MIAVQKTPGVFNCIINDDAGIVAVSPESGTLFSCHGDSVYISFTVENEGVNSLTALDATFTTDLGQTFTQTFVQAIASGSTHEFTFSTKAALVSGNNGVQIVLDASKRWPSL